jgi:hypothetical protein
MTKIEVREPNFDMFQLKMGHGLALMGHQNLTGHNDTKHWSHRCDMKLFGGNRYGVMAVSSVSFGSGLKSENQILTCPSSKWVMAWH